MTPEGIEFTKNEWIPALRSGEYTQGVGNLQHGAEFCCLGVACDLLKDRLNLTTLALGRTVKYDDRTSYLPTKVVRFLGLSAEGNLPSGSCLVNFNDAGKTFEQIADILEKEFVKEQL